MKYISTRGAAPVLDFDDVLLAGLARDGGLYLPESWPTFSADEIRALQGKPYTEIARKVITPFVAGSIDDADLKRIIETTYAAFRHDAVAPLKQLGPNDWLLELFHGPTIAFKDYALQMVGHLFDHVLSQRKERVTIVGATSGDTGSAAIEACRDRDAIDIFILFPNGRVSDVQRRQMTTVASGNVHCIAIEGDFDACQDMVKAMFNDGDLRDRLRLSAVNSINWARIMAQIVYYFHAAVGLGAPDRRLSFAVPTGNFGNIFAGYAARAMGLPIEKLVVGSNSNDILTRFFETDELKMTGVVPTISPSMDIQVSSNFERLLFDVYGRDAGELAEAMTRFRKTGSLAVSGNRLTEMSALFSAYRFDDNQTRDIIRDLYQRTGELLCPHSAIGVAAGRAGLEEDGATMVSLATAHPAKFPAAVEEASGIHPPLPPHLSDLFDREEKFTVLPNDIAAVSAFVTARTRAVPA
ncbi:threonine synthase [Alphaproteobacteria bacterium HT1-32]|nr:threonine synthase [Alphaproteobacteria bacterium HT1-32]